ncbi:methyltransferase type 11 [Streptomyces sp. NRRL B-1568]|nr:methyltransferase type 11 [Streptomyces sp. NRRL B-1568]
MTHSAGTDGYWETTGADRTFTHALDRELLSRHVPLNARVLDYGCGYGRLLAELDALGHADVQGVEPSAALVARCRKENPGLRITRAESLPLPFTDASFDAALLFAVLTSVPQEEERERAVAELARLVRPGGVLYVSDVPLQTDEASIERYRTGEAETGVYGTFRMPDGGVFVHQRPEDFHALLERHGFAVAEERQDVTPTLHGGTDVRLQIVARRGR